MSRDWPFHRPTQRLLLRHCMVAAMMLSAIPACADPQTERIEFVRRMYTNVPPLVLDMVEPIEVADAAVFEDGGTIACILKDSRGTSLGFRLDRKIGSPDRESCFLNERRDAGDLRGIAAGGGIRLIVRGPEEAALYGILLRRKRPAKPEDFRQESIDLLLASLDLRFAIGDQDPRPKPQDHENSGARDGSRYLRESGVLKARLVLKDTGGFFGGGTGWRGTIEASGDWLRTIPQDGKPDVSEGRLTNEQVDRLAARLAALDLLGLPEEITPMQVADGIDVVLQFGDRRFIFHAKRGFQDLPKPDQTTNAGRFSAIALVIREMLEEKPAVRSDSGEKP